MRKLITVSAVSALAVLLNTSAFGQFYSDAVGDEAFPNPHLDILSVEITQVSSDILFKINLAGDPIATDWGKYLVAIDSVPGGDPVGNGWGRPISMPSGMDYWIGSWVDWGDGAEVYSFDGAIWNLDLATYNAPPDDMPFPVKTPSSVTLTTSLASLGLAVGDTFVFDVFSSGGGGTDGAIDALSDPNVTVVNWGDPYTTLSTLSYTVVPEPTSIALGALGVAALFALRRRTR